MNNVVNFLLESAISLALLSTIYFLLLRKETYFRLNRLFLLGSILFSIILPFLKLRIYDPQSVMLSEITVTPYKNLLETVTIYSHDFSGTVEHAILSTNLLIMLYVAGVALLLLRFIFRITQVVVLIRKNIIQPNKNFKLVLLDKDVSPFSFLNYVFVGKNTLNNDYHDRMILHEVEHIKQGHTFDVIILEVLTIFQWFNPFMWILRRAIRENHEYLADQAVITSGVSRGNYKKLLLNQFVGNQLVIANNFNYSLIKNRIKMMSKMKSSKLALSKLLFGFVVASALIVAFACEQKELLETEETVKAADNTIQLTFVDNRLQVNATPEQITQLMSMLKSPMDLELVTDDMGNTFIEKKAVKAPANLAPGEELFFIVEDMPEFPGGEMALRQYIANNVNYPTDAQEKKIQGKVYVTFVVTKEGDIADAKIARGVDPSLDKEALRVINELPKWKPGYQRGIAVNVSYTVPINFVLQ
jgi:TonB family protein